MVSFFPSSDGVLRRRAQAPGPELRRQRHYGAFLPLLNDPFKHSAAAIAKGRRCHGFARWNRSGSVDHCNVITA